VNCTWEYDYSSAVAVTEPRLRWKYPYHYVIQNSLGKKGSCAFTIYILSRRCTFGPYIHCHEWQNKFCDYLQDHISELYGRPYHKANIITDMASSSSSFDTALIRPGVRWSHGSNCKKIKISDFLVDKSTKTILVGGLTNFASEQPESFEECVLMGVLLNVIHGSTSSSASKSLPGSQYSNYNASAGTKRAKNNNSAPYDRMFIFGDVNDPPNCFVVVCETARESRMLTEFSFNEIAIGRVFCMLEPRRTSKFIGNGDLPIVSLTEALVPLTMADKPKVLPTAISVPGDVGKQMFFVYHNVPIQLSYFYVATDDVSCSGLLCDRQHRLKQNSSCACLHTGKVNKPIVADFNVHFQRGGAGGQTESITVERCRSMRTTVLFFDDFTSFQQLSREETTQRGMGVRKKVREMVNVVNGNGGWTIVGWCKKGEVTDAANKFEKIESDDITFHVSLLQPTSLDGSVELNKVKTVEDTTSAGIDAHQLGVEESEEGIDV
jgi:hypothetical protein